MKSISITILGEELAGVEQFVLQGQSPPDPQGCPQSSPPRPFVATLLRDLEGAPGTKGFEWATGENGSLVRLEVSVELQNGAGRTTHEITMKDAYLASLCTHDDGQGAREQWVIHAGQVTFTASGDVKVFDPKLHLVPDAGI